MIRKVVKSLLMLLSALLGVILGCSVLDWMDYHATGSTELNAAFKEMFIVLLIAFVVLVFVKWVINLIMK